jgi:hypothetical protein
MQIQKTNVKRKTLDIKYKYIPRIAAVVFASPQFGAIIVVTKQQKLSA